MVIKKVGLGEDSALPVGVPVPWPSATPPTGWLKCNGATFDKVEYPKLAVAYPSGRLPDLRGEFLRGWDNARGIDSGRALISSQSDAVQRMTGSLSQMVYSVAQTASAITGVFDAELSTPNLVQAYSSAGALRYVNVDFDSQRVARTSTETRPRNVAFNYIVRAA
ncbi:phage tail protein [Escherichia coli]|uniref:phage tail protein n=1 Tax=Escherichia coli TaxID=562 RepID=UPI0009925303|nr:phage tail protein [Escherichia coli]MBV7016905.1 phage tail protein [Escherichia coli]